MRVFALFIVLWQSVFKVSNVAVTALLRFFSAFLCQLAFISNSEVLKSFSGHFPNNNNDNNNNNNSNNSSNNNKNK